VNFSPTITTIAQWFSRPASLADKCTLECDQPKWLITLASQTSGTPGLPATLDELKIVCSEIACFYTNQQNFIGGIERHYRTLLSIRKFGFNTLEVSEHRIANDSDAISVLTSLEIHDDVSAVLPFRGARWIERVYKIGARETGLFDKPQGSK
jgi:hypothetical protein